MSSRLITAEFFSGGDSIAFPGLLSVRDFNNQSFPQPELPAIRKART